MSKYSEVSSHGLRVFPDLIFLNDPLLSLLEEGALAIIADHDGGTPPALQVGTNVLLLNPTPLLQVTLQRMSHV